MKSFPIACCVAAILAAAATPVYACQGPQFESVIYPVMEEKPDQSDGAKGDVFKIRYSGERTGRQDRLWPNFYVVEVTEGKMKGQKLAIPAHVTSCHSVNIADGAEGYVIGILQKTDRDGKKLDIPILSTGLSGTVRKPYEFPARS